MPSTTCQAGTEMTLYCFLKQNAMQIAFGVILFGFALTYLLSRQFNPYYTRTIPNFILGGLILLGIFAIIGIDLWHALIVEPGWM